jgi:hypothetical protein
MAVRWVHISGANLSVAMNLTASIGLGNDTVHEASKAEEATQSRDSEIELESRVPGEDNMSSMRKLAGRVLRKAARTASED